VVFVPWSEANETTAVQSMDLGLMPLPDTPWTRGKCSFKMLQYMACGVPVAVSPIGMNRDVLAIGDLGRAAEAPGDWRDLLEWFYEHREAARQIGARGRAAALEHFDVPVVGRRLARIFHAIAAA
jgi:glycosyltransferase involved in cell wall biosynthesis